ncbi:hypothetical protein BH11ACT8_BH11ACT8_27980 [soil metagenome]
MVIAEAQDSRRGRVFRMLLGMRNPFARRPQLPATIAALSQDVEGDLRVEARCLVWPGFTSLEDAVQELVERGEANGLPAGAVHDVAERIVGEEWAVREAELATQGDTGDYGRLVGAFSALADEGILARMNFTCCQTCGSAEIDAERTSTGTAAPGRYPYAEWAYTFFHAQDAERLAEPDPTLMLSFSAFTAAPDSNAADVASGRAGDQEAMARVIAHTDATVGRAVVSALVAQGLTVAWDGTGAQRIAVSVPHWRKPMPLD